MAKNISNVRPPGGIPLNVTLHGWPVPPPEPEVRTSLPEPENTRINATTKVFNFNATGFVAFDEELMEPGFTDGQTLVLAGFGTLLTLVLAVGVVLGARILWKKYQLNKEEGYEGVLQRDESSDPGRHATNELKTSESQFTGATSEEQTSPTVLTPKSNGSVITMTLKNNHLIVETEETTCTTPSVRVDSRGSTTTYITNSTSECTGEQGAHGALIHRTPDELDDEEKQCSQTGLSQSDLSMSSSGSQNLSYRYGNQTAYDSGGYGYSENNVQPPPMHPSHSGSREFIKYTRSPLQMDRTDSVVSASDVNMFLRSDVSARNAALDRKRAKDDEGNITDNVRISENPTVLTSVKRKEDEIEVYPEQRTTTSS